MPDIKNITIVVATFNGEKTIPRMLDSLKLQQSPPLPWNLIVVNNGSNDSTAQILSEYSNYLPLTVLNQFTRGKNRALNSIFSIPIGDLVIFTDDDTIVDSEWLCTMHRCAIEHPEVDLFGGTILPHWEAIPAEWIHKAIPNDVAFAITDQSIQEGTVSAEKIWGPNMMVRRRVFDSGLRFNENIGPAAGLYIMGSETEFTVRAASLGHKTWFCPQAKVHHIIRANQLRRDWILKRAIRYGRSVRIRAYKGGKQEDIQKSMFGKLNFPRWMISDFLTRFSKGHLLRIVGKAEDSAKLLWSAYIRLGYMYQAQSENKIKN